MNITVIRARRRSRRFQPLLITLLLVVTIPVAANMRCGVDLISNGDSALQLLESCGEPSKGDVDNLDYSEWVYNFGPQHFMKKVTIIDGMVERFETLGRGYVEDEEPLLPPDND